MDKLSQSAENAAPSETVARLPQDFPPAEDTSAKNPSTKDLPAGSPLTEDPPAENPPAENPPARSPLAEDPPAENPPAEDPPARSPLAEDPPAENLLQQKKDEKYMRAALKQAQKALALGEVPIGAVIVFEDKIIARGYNRRNTEHTTLAHAEMAAIRKANRKLGDWRLEGCTLYCTLEPCQMCAGALIQSRIDRVVIGAPGNKAGSLGTVVNILQNEAFNHQADVTFGVLQDECAEILRTFFRDLRRKNKMRKKEST